MPYLGTRIIPTTSTSTRGLGCNFATGGYPHFQPIYLPLPGSGLAWNVTKIGCLLRFNNAKSTRLALYADNGSQGIDNTCVLLCQGEVAESSPSTYAELEADVGPVALDPTEQTFWIGIKSADDDSNNDWDSANYFTELKGQSILGVYRYGTCVSWANGDEAWPDPLGITPSLNLSEYSLHVWIHAEEVALTEIASEQDFPAFHVAAALDPRPDDRSEQVFPAFSLDASGDSDIDYVTPTDSGPVHYQAVLSANGFSDYTLPLASFNLRLRQSPNVSYLIASIPAILDHADAINNRIDGTLTINRVTGAGSTSLITANVQELRMDIEARNRNGALYCTNQQTYSTPQALTASPTFYSYQNGVKRYRMPVYPVFPGDAVFVDGAFFIVDQASYAISSNRAQLEIEVSDG